MIKYVSERDSITFKPTGLIIGGTEKKLSSKALVKIDVLGVGQLFIEDNDIRYNFGTKNLSGIRYGDVVYNYDDEIVRDILKVYSNGRCFHCQQSVPITARNIIGFKAAKFIMFCPHCKRLSSYWVERDRVKPVIIVKPSAIVRLETVMKSVYDVFPGTFKGTDSEITFHGRLQFSGNSSSVDVNKFYRYSMSKDKIKKVFFHSGKELELTYEEEKPKTKRKINPNDIVVIYTKGDICYRLINIISFKGGHLHFNAAKRDAVDGRVYKITVPITSVESFVVGKVLYKMSDVEFEVPE